MKLNKLMPLMCCAIMLCLNGMLGAQENNFGDSLSGELLKIRSELDLHNRIQWSGYLQPQFQLADTQGVASFAGGNFASGTRDRFTMRRARLKAVYSTTHTQYVFQLDATERGVAIRDMYARITEPWLNSISLTAGNMNRPFGFEVPYSSGLRESPERGRMSQILFPGERDLGMMLTFQKPKSSRWNFLKIEAGLFNGTGQAASDYDSRKDFIGNIGIQKTNRRENVQYAFRLSYYNGGEREETSSNYIPSFDNAGHRAFLLRKDTAIYGSYARREYLGADGQLTLDWPLGLSTFRAEYILGRQPGTSANTASPSSQPAGDFYLRNFDGAYFYLLQNIGQSKHQLVIKYDWYDPNTDVRGDGIGETPVAEPGKVFRPANAADLRFSTLGLGWIFHWDNNVKFMAYYDLVRNETSTHLSGWNQDRKDNVFTFRIQYRF